MEDDIPPQDKLKFAKWVLLFLLLVFLMGAITEIFRPQNNVFEACRTILPTLVTLVLGYYFGKM